MADVIKQARPTRYGACAGCKEAAKYLAQAGDVIDINNVLQLTAVCSNIQGKSDEHPGTANMQIVALKPEGEAGHTEPVKLDSGATQVTVYCAGALE